MYAHKTSAQLDYPKTLALWGSTVLIFDTNYGITSDTRPNRIATRPDPEISASTPTPGPTFHTPSVRPYDHDQRDDWSVHRSPLYGSKRFRVTAVVLPRPGWRPRRRQYLNTHSFPHFFFLTETVKSLRIRMDNRK